MCGIRSRGGRERGKNRLPTLIFCPFFDNQQKFVKEDDVSKKKWGSPTSLHRKIQAKLSFWPKVLYLPTNLPPCARSMNDMAPLRHEICVRSRDAQKQLARTSLTKDY